MSLFTEIAITPQVFLKSSYDTEAEHALALGFINTGVLPCTAIRDLRCGEWSRFLGRAGILTPRGKEILKVIAKRLVPARRANLTKPSQESDWLAEALASASERELGFILMSDGNREDLQASCPVLGVVGFASKAPDVLPPISIRLNYSNEDYRRVLEPLLLTARYASFYDPYLDPLHRDYTHFHKLLECLPRRENRHIRLQFHTSHGGCLWGDNSSRGTSTVNHEHPCQRVPNSNYSKENYWRNSFQTLSDVLMEGSISADVFVWDKFEERYFSTNLVTIMAGKGFKVLKKVHSHSWSRLERADADNIEWEFEENSGKHKCHLKFRIGKGS